MQNGIVGLMSNVASHQESRGRDVIKFIYDLYSPLHSKFIENVKGFFYFLLNIMLCINGIVKKKLPSLKIYDK